VYVQALEGRRYGKIIGPAPSEMRPAAGPTTVAGVFLTRLIRRLAGGGFAE